MDGVWSAGWSGALESWNFACRRARLPSATLACWCVMPALMLTAPCGSPSSSSTRKCCPVGVHSVKKQRCTAGSLCVVRREPADAAGGSCVAMCLKKMTSRSPVRDCWNMPCAVGLWMCTSRRGGHPSCAAAFGSEYVRARRHTRGTPCALLDISGRISTLATRTRDLSSASACASASSTHVCVMSTRARGKGAAVSAAAGAAAVGCGGCWGAPCACPESFPWSPPCACPQSFPWRWPGSSCFPGVLGPNMGMTPICCMKKRSSLLIHLSEILPFFT
mmetsp:Transcript_27957/g.70149  ORF Transcript_27957/g.70149 Transcript_27957/m.70149 type:complete len:277 (+) Transcript_27957:912-1742(+)